MVNWLLPWVLLWATTFPIMYVDQKRQDAKRAKSDVPDLRDKSFSLYYVLGLFSGMLILPVYFYVSRGKKSAILIGLGWSVLAFVVAAFLRGFLMGLFGLSVE
jgi:hypothetical protein